MYWLEFFFGWLTKGQMNLSVLDGIMFFLELMLVIFIVVKFGDLLDFFDRRKKKK